MLLHTGRSGLRPSELCLFNTDLYRGPMDPSHRVRGGKAPERLGD